MRIAIVSDIHGNLTALEAVIADFDETRPDWVWHGGDLATHGHRPAEVIDRIRELGWPGVVGNTDELLWNPGNRTSVEARMPPQARPLLKALYELLAPAARELVGDRVEYLQSLPTEFRQDELYLTHATPGDLWIAPKADAGDEELAATYRGTATRTAVYCHIHTPFVRQLPELTVCNTGSVGLPFDGDPRASYLLIEDGVPTVRRVAYDVEAEVRSLRASGYPLAEWLAANRLTGRFSPPPDAEGGS
jgi:putative phosphoesterase